MPTGPIRRVTESGTLGGGWLHLIDTTNGPVDVVAPDAVDHGRMVEGVQFGVIWSAGTIAPGLLLNAGTPGNIGPYRLNPGKSVWFESIADTGWMAID